MHVTTGMWTSFTKVAQLFVSPCSSWSKAEPGGEKHQFWEGEMLLFLLAGSTLVRQRERDIGADDRGAGRGARGTGAQDPDTRP